MGTSNTDERTARERLQEALKHNKHMDQALRMSDQAFQKVMKDCERLQGDAARQAAVIEQLQENNTQLASKINDAGKPYIARIQELVRFCKQNGINPDTGEKKE